MAKVKKDMHYYHDIVVRYQDTDDNKKLRLQLLEQYLLETAGNVADRLGFGMQKLNPRNLGWILTHLSVEMEMMPTCLEHLRFETWIESNSHKLSTRVFRIYRVKDESAETLELIGRAKSVWTVLDLEKREIVDIFDDPMFEGAVDGEVLEMPRAPRMRLMPEVTGERESEVFYSDLDYNGHCNSCQYLMKMIDLHRPDLSKPFALHLIYAHEVHFGDKLKVGYTLREDGVQYQIVAPTGELSSACYFQPRA